MPNGYKPTQEDYDAVDKAIGILMVIAIALPTFALAALFLIGLICGD